MLFKFVNSLHTYFVYAQDVAQASKALFEYIKMTYTPTITTYKNYSLVFTNFRRVGVFILEYLFNEQPDRLISKEYDVSICNLGTIIPQSND